MRNIVLVEDDPFLIDIYTLKIKEAGFDVKAVEDGGRALSVLEKEKPDLLLLDIVLPNYDGWEILKKVREKKEFQSLPVIILSNLGQKQEVEKGLNLGAVKYLIKAHYTPTEVVEEIKKILNKD